MRPPMPPPMMATLKSAVGCILDKREQMGYLTASLSLFNHMFEVCMLARLFGEEVGSGSPVRD